MKNEIKEMTELLQELGNKNADDYQAEKIVPCLMAAGYRKQSDTVKEFAEKLRIAIDKITDTHGITELNLYTKVYVRKPAVMDIINELVAEYGVTVWR